MAAMMKFLMALAALIAAPAMAHPVYLTCDMGQRSTHIVVDEERGWIAVEPHFDSGPAEFTPATVSFDDHTLRFVIDRVTLKISEWSIHMGLMRTPPLAGQCVITPTPVDRQI
jgi:hypothetical protein